jgi:two-component system OmpR family sensor kinase
MDKLVGELLTLSRLEASEQIPATEEVALMDLVDGIVADARFEAEQQGREIEVCGEAPVSVRCAPDLLWSAIENVIRNAIKHSPQGGAVTVELGVAGGMVRIAVLDRGPGVDPAELQAMFAPFYRLGPGAAGVDGHGLGLAIAQRVVGAHGGAIAASNRDGGGLCVAITLPVAGQDQPDRIKLVPVLVV